jgi:hypothetical protein
MIDGGDAGIATLPETGDGDRTRWPPQTAVLGGGTLVVGEVEVRCGWQVFVVEAGSAWSGAPGPSTTAGGWRHSH